MVRGRNGPCVICDTLPVGDLLDLDMVMGDSASWPSTIWGIFPPPAGMIPASYMRFGAEKMGAIWLEDHGYTFAKNTIRSHFRFDVAVVAHDASDLVNRGLIDKAGRKPQVEQIDPTAFLKYFDRGIKLGNRALELLATRLAKMEQDDEDIPAALLMKFADLAGKLATTQATLRARGLKMGEENDEDEGFRAGSVEGGIPSGKFRHQRIRVVDGEARPVTDNGRGDRERYSKRSREEGGSGLPH